MTMWLITDKGGGFEVSVIGIIAGVGAVQWERIPFPTLEGARSVVPEGSVCVPRDPEDPPRVVETWKRA